MCDIREKLYTGAFSTAIYDRCKDGLDQFTVLRMRDIEQAAHADGFQEFLFDMLTNFSSICRVSLPVIEQRDNSSAAVVQSVLKQFKECFPERGIDLCTESGDGRVSG